jgi:hypothetical protein
MSQKPTNSTRGQVKWLVYKEEHWEWMLSTHCMYVYVQNE